MCGLRARAVLASNGWVTRKSVLFTASIIANSSCGAGCQLEETAVRWSFSASQTLLVCTLRLWV